MANRKQVEPKYLVQGLLIGTVLRVLISAALVGFTDDWTWLIFGLTLGWAFGIGIALEINPTTRRSKN